MSKPTCPESFEGTVSDFIALISRRTFLRAEAVAQAQLQVERALETSECLLVRNFGQYQKAAQPHLSSNRGRVFVVGDNEPVVWFWRHLYEAKFVDLVDALLRRSIPISMAVSKGEKEADWATWGSGDAARPQDRWRGVHGGRWKLCHIFPAAPSHLDDSEGAILARFVRNFHPVNQFWFASDYAWKNHGRYEMSPVGRLGEWPDVCMAFWREYCARYPSEAAWFRERAQLSEAELAAASTITDPLIGFRWSADISADSSPHQASPMRSRTTRHADAAGPIGVCVIRETSSGRFHLSGMGASIGGPDRGAPFKFQVLDASERLIAESSIETAEALGIAERGRGDYDSDSYRQTDFMKWEDGQGLIPWQALAKRVQRWTYF